MDNEINILDIVACPQCQGDLQKQEEELCCSACSLLFPVEDGIPILLLEEAKQVTAEA